MEKEVYKKLENDLLLNEDLRENLAGWARLHGRLFSAQDILDFCK